MAKKRTKGKDPLGKLLLFYTSTNPGKIATASIVCGLGLIGIIVTAAALQSSVYGYALSGILFVAGGISTMMAVQKCGETFEVFQNGVRYTTKKDTFDIPWEEMKSVKVRKFLIGGETLRVTDYDLGNRTYRGKGVKYVFAFNGEFDKIVVPDYVLCNGPDPQTLLKRVEKFIPDKVSVFEPNDDDVFSDYVN